MSYSNNSTTLANNILRKWKKDAVTKAISEAPGLAPHIYADGHSRDIRGFLSSKGLNSPRKDNSPSDIFELDDAKINARSTRDSKNPFVV